MPESGDVRRDHRDAYRARGTAASAAAAPGRRNFGCQTSSRCEFPETLYRIKSINQLDGFFTALLSIAVLETIQEPF
jgi:hypothetical protein